MNAAYTHIEIAAHHEMGHTLAALKQGRYVGRVHVDKELAGDGMTLLALAPRNPFDVCSQPQLAWRHTVETTRASVFILLAGPVAEAKLLRKPIRHPGSRSDYRKCLDLVDRLPWLAEFARQYGDIPEIEPEDLLNTTRDRVRRWVARPQTWSLIQKTANILCSVGYLDGDRLSWAIGSARKGGELELFGRSAARPVASVGRELPYRKAAYRL